ncbi:hypothetical protein HPB48_004525 [Haemaphysalis longicornis]|uniref:Uncharacterized protein n=1 Tax=Haemaphysalis longicornis TaxID=44386 RepID=A0A9J6FZ25_HAELO|nr:hypothetical protein HPB48_004525 [Haemaphysalis longicornis]
MRRGHVNEAYIKHLWPVARQWYMLRRPLGVVCVRPAYRGNAAYRPFARAQWSCLPFLTTTTAVGTIGPPHNYWLGKIEDTDLSQMIDLFLMTIFGGIPWQVYFQRVLSADSIFTAKMLSYMSALGCIFFAIPPVIVGAVAKSASTLIVTPIFSAPLHRTTTFEEHGRATDVEVTTVLRITLCVISLSATVMALNVESVFYLWTLSSDLVYVLLFPQFVALFFLRSQSNTYGAVVVSREANRRACNFKKTLQREKMGHKYSLPSPWLAGFVVGVTTRAACGEPEMGVPMLVQLPLYDAERGQQFPFRTLCMLLSLGSLLAVSKLAECAFYTGVLPDILHCFRVDPEAALESPASPAKTARTKSASISAAGQSLGHPLEQKGGNTTESAESMSPSTTKKQRKKSTSALPAAVQAARRDTLPNATSLPPHAVSSARRKSSLPPKRASDAEWKTTGSDIRVMSALTARRPSAKRRGTLVPEDHSSSEPAGKSQRKGSQSKDAGSKGSARSSKAKHADATEDGKGERDATRRESTKVTGQIRKPT